MSAPILRISLLLATVSVLAACGGRETPAPAPPAESPAAPAAPVTGAAPAVEPTAVPPAAPQSAAEAAKPEAAVPQAPAAAPPAAKPKGMGAPAKAPATAAAAPAVAPVAPPAAAPAAAAPAPKPVEAAAASPAPAPKAASSAGGASKVVDPGGDVAVPAKAGTTRIGPEKCRMCHKVQFESWRASAHAKRTPPLDCESCHGPGSDYKTLGVMKDPAKAKAAGLVLPDAAFCARCHKGTVDAAYLAKAHAHKTTS